MVILFQQIQRSLSKTVLLLQGHHILRAFDIFRAFGNVCKQGKRSNTAVGKATLSFQPPQDLNNYLIYSSSTLPADDLGPRDFVSSFPVGKYAYAAVRTPS